MEKSKFKGVIAVFEMANGEDFSCSQKRIRLQMDSMDELDREVKCFGIENLVAIEEWK